MAGAIIRLFEPIPIKLPNARHLARVLLFCIFFYQSLIDTEKLHEISFKSKLFIFVAEKLVKL
jgi:hypothetical protein